MASADGVREWVHPFISDQGTLAEIIKGIQQGLEAVTRSTDTVESGFRIDSALGLSLDALGALFGHKRQEGLGDNDYRNQLLTLVEDSTTQTVSVVERTVEWISGYTPTVEEPDPGTIRVRLPLNKVQYAADVYAQLNRVKAAGIRVIVGHLEEFFESFSETLLVADYLLNMMRGMFYESFVEPWPLIGGSGQWDWGNWDASGAKWDSSDEPSDDLLIWWTHQLIETYSDANWDDDLFFIGVLYPPVGPETLDTPTDALLFDGVLYFSDDLSGFYDESVLLKGILYETESLSDYEDELERIGLLFTEPTLSTPTDAMSGAIVGYFIEPTLPTPDDDILIAWNREFAEVYPRRVAIIGSAVIGTHVIGFGVDIVYDHEWDSGSWDYAWWDKSNSSDMVVVVREVF